MISIGLLVFGYIVSLVLSYIILKRCLLNGSDGWTCGDRIIGIIISIGGPISLVGSLFAYFIISIWINFDKPAKW